MRQQRFASERQPASSRDGRVHKFASVALPMLPVHSMVAVRCQELLSVINFGASSIPPLQRIRPCLPKDLGKACAHSFCVTFVSRGRLLSTFGFMTSARIASPCFTRPRFELGLSSPAPQVSAKRVRLSCSSRGSSRPFITM